MPRRLLNDYERAISQLIMSKGAIEDTILTAQAALLQQDFPGNEHLKFADIFSRINDNIRSVSLEVKTVALIDGRENSTSARKYYHGIVNTDPDTVSKELGSHFDQYEIKFFSDLVQRLLQTKFLDTLEVIEFKASSWSASKAETVLNNLVHENWLMRNDRGFVTLGPRTYIELTLFLQESREAALAQGGDVPELPQMIIY